MFVSRRSITHKIMACGQNLEQVEAFKYLGVNTASDGKINSEINSRTEAAGRMFYSTRASQIDLDQRRSVLQEKIIVTATNLASPLLQRDKK
ncbi:hypothetical protein ILUMI_02557 [Ignelater luminosus]|uniref:Uncharacterized protein n=1 Tax=Ignelater luminosus TaxID=2038154 RepID=A0A8K0DNJ6_IGNLU|nr:hypothetical protein ILUMI_02557 [Ignelater luminosus]